MIGSETFRRYLTFPAVYPAENISPSTLLSSLTNLATQISRFKRESFSSNKQNERKCTRFVTILVNLLEELNENSSDLPDSTVLGLSEMHLAFQKIIYLLEDCVQEGTKLLMLMKSEIVAGHFGSFISSILTALDVIPSDFLSEDVKEGVEMVMRQARRTKFNLAAEDEVLIGKVCSILDRFGGKNVCSDLEEFLAKSDFSLDMRNLAYVVEYLGIGSWSECDSEIKFLSTQIGLRSWGNADELMMGGLIGLMTYARVLVFDVVDVQMNVKPVVVDISVYQHNADDFRCPISLETMSDPVTIATGQTYDRISITTWFRAGNVTCPKTGEVLKSMDLVQNYAVKKLIRQHCAANGILVSEPATGVVKKRELAECAAVEGATKRAARYLVLKLSCGRSAERNKAAFEIRLLAKISVSNRSCLTEAGVIPHLLDLLTSVDPATQENAIAALLNLSKHDRSKSVIMEYGGLSLVLDVLKTGLKMEAKQHAAAVLFYLSSVDEFRRVIGETPEAIPALVDMVRDGQKRGKKNALVAIFGLLMHQDNRWRVLKAGIVPLLLDLLHSPDLVELSSDCFSVLSILSETPDGAFSILRRGGLRLCTHVLISSSLNSASEFCVSTLLNLCINCGGDLVAILANDQSLIKSLYSILAIGTSRASRKSSLLLRKLHEFHERKSSSGPRPETTAMSGEHYYVQAW